MSTMEIFFLFCLFLEWKGEERRFFNLYLRCLWIYSVNPLRGSWKTISGMFFELFIQFKERQRYVDIFFGQVASALLWAWQYVLQHRPRGARGGLPTPSPSHILLLSISFNYCLSTLFSLSFALLTSWEGHEAAERKSEFGCGWVFRGLIVEAAIQNQVTLPFTLSLFDAWISCLTPLSSSPSRLLLVDTQLSSSIVTECPINSPSTPQRTLKSSKRSAKGQVKEGERVCVREREREKEEREKKGEIGDRMVWLTGMNFTDFQIARDTLSLQRAKEQVTKSFSQFLFFNFFCWLSPPLHPGESRFLQGKSHILLCPIDRVRWYTHFGTQRVWATGWSHFAFANGKISFANTFSHSLYLSYLFLCASGVHLEAWCGLPHRIRLASHRIPSQWSSPLFGKSWCLSCVTPSARIFHPHRSITF